MVNVKIGRKQSQDVNTNLVWVAFLILALVAGVFLGDRGLTQALQAAWQDSIPRLRAATTNGEAALPTLVVDMPFNAFNNILAQREEALQTGVFIASANDFQSATIRLNGTSVPVRLRLRQGPAVHLGDDDKWNFDVRTRDNQTLFDMQRFYLMDPADNNWLNEWAFSRTLRREGLLAARYRFVRLVFNGDDRGIYALQEGFGPELIASQGRTEGVIVEFDANRLWESVAYFEGDAEAALADPVTNLTASDFQYFEVDTFRDADIADDELLSAQKDTAIGLLRGLQSGELAASDVFDVDKYGRFLALTDLWGATNGTSLVNLRYYYNPQSGRLEPIGFNADALGSEARLSLTATYHDPALQAAYARAAQRYSQPEYLDELREELGPTLTSLQQTLAPEVDLTLPWDTLAQRQEEMRRSLNPIQPIFAYLGPPSMAMSATIQIDVANVLNLPVEIMGFDIGGATFLEVDREWLQGEPADLLVEDPDKVVLRAFDDQQQDVLRFVRFHLPLTEIVRQDNELDFLQEVEILVATRILGFDRAQLTPARPGYPDPLLGPMQVEPNDTE